MAKGLQKIISGGQTGVDRGALDAALKAGFPCGGWCPAGRWAEDGVIPEAYPLREVPGGGYRERTLRNVLDSDGTLVIHFGPLGGGTALTVQECIRHGKPYHLVDGSEVDVTHAASFTADFIETGGIKVLNVSGPRQSQEPLAHSYAFDLVSRVMEDPAMTGPGTDDTCPRCGGRMVQTDKNTFTGTVWREYTCQGCGHMVDVDEGTALWQVLHDDAAETGGGGEGSPSGAP